MPEGGWIRSCGRATTEEKKRKKEEEEEEEEEGKRPQKTLNTHGNGHNQ
jgi:hypothetical protein